MARYNYLKYIFFGDVEKSTNHNSSKQKNMHISFYLKLLTIINKFVCGKNLTH